MGLVMGLLVPVAARQGSDLVTDVRAAAASHDYARGDALVAAHRARSGVTPEMLVAVSWLGRGALADKRFDAADRYAHQAYDLAQVQLARRPLDQEPQLPVAIGNAVDVLSQVLVERGARSEAVALLTRELTRHRSTSIEKRIQKTLNLLTLEGTVAPPLDLSESLGAALPTLASLKGKVVILFFWAHWCPDCKAQAPILATIATRYAPRGLILVAPTQRYGYVAEGRTAGKDEEKVYIGEIRQTYYPVLAGVPIPLAEANHKRYGVSSTPTLALLDRQGIVRLYHPGRMTEVELDAAIQGLL
jgi:thiol-disulfide isomerase/thioredoxin